MPTTLAERQRLSRFPICLGMMRDQFVRRDKRQRLSSLASISRRQQEQRQRQEAGTLHPPRALHQGAVAVADSEQIVGTVERMARDGATSLLPIVPSAQAPSTQPVRPHPVAEEACPVQV